METTTLGPLTVSRLALGAMLMGDSTPAAEAHRMLDRFLDAGGTFVDTADTYTDSVFEQTLAGCSASTAWRRRSSARARSSSSRTSACLSRSADACGRLWRADVGAT